MNTSTFDFKKCNILTFITSYSYNNLYTTSKSNLYGIVCELDSFILLLTALHYVFWATISIFYCLVFWRFGILPFMSSECYFDHFFKNKLYNLFIHFLSLFIIILFIFSGYIAMSDNWFSEFVYEVVVDKKYLTSDMLDVLKQTPVVLPAWDPMGALA